MYASFSERYGQLRESRTAAARERTSEISERLLQCIWYDQLFDPGALVTDTGARLRVISPGWWNLGEGPDFKGAQLELNGKLKAGDVEIHLRPRAWRDHGHHNDTRYDKVLLHVVLDGEPAPNPTRTADGRRVHTLTLRPHIRDDVQTLTRSLDPDSYPHAVDGTLGKCAGIVESYGAGGLIHLLNLAGEWRMLFKARAMRRRADRVGFSQALYEAFLRACGYARYQTQFESLARDLPYDRIRQLAREDARLAEAALLHSAGLLPDPANINPAPRHLLQTDDLRSQRLPGLRAMALEWPRNGVRPVNYPERRIAGASRVLARTARDGLAETIERTWLEDRKPLQRRRDYEALFPRPTGFWAQRCTWTGKTMATSHALIGPGRVRAIIGNVIVPAGLALARIRSDRAFEERVFEFFAALPSEPENKVHRIMLPRIFGDADPPRPTFRLQQGLIQMHADWCEPNPSCRNCSVIPALTGLASQNEP